MPSKVLFDEKGEPLASDGLRARANGQWAEEKLSFLDRYCPPALRIARNNFPNSVYLDLFAGPGVNISLGNRIETLSGALRVVSRSKASSGANQRHFTHAILVNKSADDHNALGERLDGLEASGSLALPRERIFTVLDDANRVVDRLPQLLPLRPYVFVFADIENPSQWPWHSVKALRAAIPSGLDYYGLYPDDMAIRRLLPYAPYMISRSEPTLDEFFGTTDWREIWRRRQSTTINPQLGLFAG